MSAATWRNRRGRLTEVSNGYRCRWRYCETAKPAALCSHSAGFQDVNDGCQGRVYFAVGVVEMRREAHSGLGTPIHKNVAGQKFAAHLLGVGHVDGNGAASLLGIARSVDAPSVPVGELDQAGGLALRFLADLLNANFANNSQAGPRRLDRGNVRGSIHESKGLLGIANGASGEGKRIFVGKPSSKLRLQFLAQIGPDVEVRNPRPSTEPLEHASAGEVGVERLDVHRHGAQRLESVEDDVSANFVRFVDDGFGVVDVGAAKNHVRDGNDQSLFVDGVKQAIGGDGDAVIGFHHVNLSAVLALRFPEMHHGGKVHVAVNDLVALAGEVKTRSHHGLTSRYVLMKRNAIFGRVHQSANFVANFRSQHPPAFFPGANAAGRPNIGVGMERVINGAGHGSEGIRNHVISAREDGKLRAVAQ